MAKNLKLLIAYDGSNYSGWQRQINAPTIQGTIETCLSTITNQNISLHGAGRTDAGVHALGMVAHFLTEAKILPEKFHQALNSMLPDDIRILACNEEQTDFHSRYNARGKTYRYDFHIGPILSPIEVRHTVHCPYLFDFTNINKCLNLILGTHDFTSFEASGSRDKTQTKGRGAVRTLCQARCEPSKTRGATYSFIFTGDGFLRHMVRNLVGTLFEVSKKKLTPEDFQVILESRNRIFAGPTAPAKGLFLVEVFYDYLPKYPKNDLNS